MGSCAVRPGGAPAHSQVLHMQTKQSEIARANHGNLQLRPSQTRDRANFTCGRKCKLPDSVLVQLLQQTPTKTASKWRQPPEHDLQTS